MGMYPYLWAGWFKKASSNAPPASPVEGPAWTPHGFVASSWDEKSFARWLSFIFSAAQDRPAIHLWGM